MEGFLRYQFGGLTFGGAYTWRGLFPEFYCIFLKMVRTKCRQQTTGDHCFHHANENVSQIVPLLSNRENN